MKANELMIGDYVKCHYESNEWVARVSSIYQDSIWIEDTEFEGMELCEGQFEPIPLTPEILEKNGFKETRCHSMQYRDAGVYMHYWHNRFGIHYGCAPITNINIRCEYVHTLQHALKLCGIDKEIVL